MKTYLSFKIGAEYYVINVDNVKNISEYCSIARLHFMPEFISGLIYKQDRAMLVIDLSQKIGKGKTKISDNTCIIILEIKIENDFILAGIMVDEVAEILEIEDEEIKALPTIGFKMKFDFIEGIIYKNNYPAIILNTYKILADEQIFCIEQLPV